MAKKKSPPATCPPSPRGAIPLGQVIPELMYFAPTAPAYTVREIANSIAKELEMHYQLELLRLSGFGT